MAVNIQALVYTADSMVNITTIGFVVAGIGLLVMGYGLKLLYPKADKRYKTGYKDNVEPNPIGYKYMFYGLILLCVAFFMLQAILNPKDTFDSLSTRLVETNI
jgi:hypothetical protein